jgi:hypothetical protein
MSDYINPETATKVRIINMGNGTFNIDAADDNGGYTEVCWDSYVTEEGCFKDITSIEHALFLVPVFAKENVPHLKGSEAIVTEG